MPEQVIASGKVLDFEQGKIYNLSYPARIKTIGSGQHGKRFWFVGTNPGAGVTHYLFKSVAGGYIVSYTEIDFMCGSVRMSQKKF